MNPSQFNTVLSLPKLHEASALKSQREPQSIYHIWKYINATTEASNKHSRDIAQLNRELKKINDRKKMGFELFPFKIYVLPDIFRGTPNVNTNTNWRTVRVRGGYVLTDEVSTGSYVRGTDGLQEYAYGNSYDLTTGSADITLSDNSFYWFWVEENSSSYNLRYDTNPNSSGSIGNPNGWTSFPTADSNHIPIGYVDTESSSSNHQALIRNLIDSDIVIKGGGGFIYKDYVEDDGISAGTVIWVDPNTNYSRSFYDTGSGGGPPLGAGLWYTNKDVPPATSGSRPVGNFYYPFYPTIPPSAEITISGSTFNSIYFKPMLPLRSNMQFCDVTGQEYTGFGLFIPTGSVYDFALPHP